MSLRDKYQNVKFKNKLIANLTILFMLFALTVGLIYFYLNKTFSYINAAEELIENYKMLNQNSHSFSNIQDYISESITSLTVNTQKWTELVEPAEKNLIIIERYMHTAKDSSNLANAKHNFDNITHLYKKEILVKIGIAKEIISDTSYTDFSINEDLHALLKKTNKDFFVLNRNLSNLKKDALTEILNSYTQINSTKKTVFITLFFSFIPFLLFLILFYYIFRNVIINQIDKLIEIVENIAIGDISEQIDANSTDEIGKIKKAIQTLLVGLNSITVFAKEIETGNFDAEFEARSNQDELGIALKDMRTSLQKAKKKEHLNQKEDDKKNWAANEITRYGDILRKNNNELSKLADAIIQNLINTLNANQGGLFVINDDNPEDVMIELIASYAFDRKKFHKKKIELGEGLVGACAIEKDTIHLKEIPTDYIEIISGLGTSSPRNLILVPLKLENKILGVVELASFSEFEQHKIEFLEQVAENIAATLATTKINAKTALLLSQSRVQADELASQEEEMRQNMEELQATQEEAARQAVELQGVFDAINENTGTIEFSPEGIVLDANEYVLKLLRIKMSFVDQKHHSNIVSVEEKNSDEFYTFWQDIRSGETKISTRRYFVAQKELWLRETFKPLYDSNGNLYKVLAMYTNITDSEMQKRTLEEQSGKLIDFQAKMKINQEELKKSNEILESRSEILKKALDKSKKIESELNEKNELMGKQEAELIDNLEKLAVIQEEMEMKTTTLTAENKGLSKEKNKIKAELNRTLKIQKDLEEEVERLKK